MRTRFIGIFDLLGRTSEAQKNRHAYLSSATRDQGPDFCEGTDGGQERGGATLGGSIAYPIAAIGFDLSCGRHRGSFSVSGFQTSGRFRAAGFQGDWQAVKDQLVRGRKFLGFRCDSDPYDSKKIPGSILRIEEFNFENGKQRDLRGYAIAAKRYALFRRTADGGIKIEKASARNSGIHSRRNARVRALARSTHLSRASLYEWRLTFRESLSCAATPIAAQLQCSCRAKLMLAMRGRNHAEA